MSKPEITKTGVEIEEFNDIFESLVDKYKSIYGQDINLDSDSPDGQRVGIIAKMSHDLQVFAHSIYSNLDPDFTAGVPQNTLIKFNGISRNPPSRSQKDITIITSKALTLPIDFELKDDLDQLWTITEKKKLSAGENVVTFYAKKFGPIESLSTATFTPQLIVDGVVSVGSTQPAILGKDEETDEDLRKRRNKTFENAAYSTVGGLLSKLLVLPNVTDAVVYENDQSTHDTDKDMPPKSIWCIVQGGEVDNIIECLVKNKTAGTYTKGHIAEDYIECVTRADASVFKIVHTMRFDRSKSTPLHVRLTVKRRNPKNSIDTSQIISALTKRKFYINSSINASELYADIYSIDGQFTAYDLEISDDGENFTYAGLTSDYDASFVITADNVEVSEVI